MTMRALWQRWFGRDECVEVDVPSPEERRKAHADKEDATLQMRMNFKAVTGAVDAPLEAESVEVLVAEEEG